MFTPLQLQPSGAPRRGPARTCWCREQTVPSRAALPCPTGRTSRLSVLRLWKAWVKAQAVVHTLWPIIRVAEVPVNSAWLLVVTCGNCHVTSRCLHKALPPLQGAKKSEVSQHSSDEIRHSCKMSSFQPSPKKRASQKGLYYIQFFQSQPQHLASLIQTWN